MIAQKGFYFNSFSSTTYVTVVKAKILCRMVNKCCLLVLKEIGFWAGIGMTMYV